MKCISRQQFRSVWTSVIHYGKRRYPVNEEEAKELPIFQYPVASLKDHRVYAWGLAEHGALGNGLELKKKKKPIARYQHRPCRLKFAEEHKVIDIACGYGFTAFAVRTKDKYKVYGCGINTDSQIGYHAPHKDHPLGLVLYPAPIEMPLQNPKTTKVVAVAAGRAHLLVLTDEEGVFSLGHNAYGQCGRRIVPNEKYSGSQLVHCIPDVDGIKIKSIECGQDHSIFLSEAGEVYACGWGADGQTGLGHFESQCQPSKVVGDVEGENIVRVVSSVDTVLAVNDKGDVFGWGNSEYGQLSSIEPQQQQNCARYLQFCKSLGRIVDVAVGGASCIVVNDVGQVFVWGYGLLGKGPAVDQALQPILIPETLFGKNEFDPDSHVTAVCAGISHFAAVTNHGSLYMWGHNRGGCLGLGHIKDQYFPLKVAVGAKVKKISCGVDHTAALCQPFV